MNASTPATLSGRVSLRINARVVVQVLLLLLLLIHGVRSQDKQNTFNTIQPGLKPGSLAVDLKRVAGNQVIVDNGIIQVTFSDPQGLITGIKYNGIDNVLDETNIDRGYWDVVWYEPSKLHQTDKLHGTRFSIINQTQEQIEISFARTWNMSFRDSHVPLNVDKRYIIRSGVSGIYSYGVLERLAGWPDVNMDQTRIVFKLNPNIFNFMAISDDQQRTMPSAADRDIKSGRAKALDYKEAVFLENPDNPMLEGEVDDKYMYSCEDKDNKVHGWISLDPHVGFWMITPSDEFRNGGPVKQDLTSHTGPITLSMFTSTHYAGLDMQMRYSSKEAWKKVFGPVFTYLNSLPPTDNNVTANLWNDAKNQMLKEVESWPYNFVKSADYPLADQRGNVSGQLYVKDRYVSKINIYGKSAYVGLAPPGEAGSWQTEAKGYQYWTQADDMGRFMIDKVRPGNYSLFAWVPGCIGDYKYENDITITSDSEMKLGSLVYEPPRNGPTLWEIGVPDRTAAEFAIPNPDPSLVNKLYLRKPRDKFRQYGLWKRYADLYPQEDLVYKVETSDYKKDWFFAQVNRQTGKNTYNATTWRIVFNAADVNQAGNYTLQLALASASYSNIQVRVNEANSEPVFSTGMIGKDNAIARHGIHGLYRLFSVRVPAKSFRTGENNVYLTQSLNTSTYQGVMYDYIRLEGPPPV